MRALPIESPLDAAAAAVALTVLTGLHTFLGFLREAFPINHFLEIAVLVAGRAESHALKAACPSGSRGWLIDLLAAITFVVAALTLESGVLIWVVIATAWMVGLRGVSTRGLVLVTALLAGYFVLRFWYLDTGLPSLDRADLGILSRAPGAVGAPAAVRRSRRSCSTPTTSSPRYCRCCSRSRATASSSRPARGAAATFTRMPISTVLSSLAMTVVMAWAAFAWWRARDRTLGRSGRLAIVAVVVLVANAALSFSYTKDDIIAVAGVFYAIAAFAAVRAALEYATGAADSCALRSCRWPCWRSGRRGRCAARACITS